VTVLGLIELFCRGYNARHVPHEVATLVAEKREKRAAQQADEQLLMAQKQTMPKKKELPRAAQAEEEDLPAAAARAAAAAAEEDEDEDAEYALRPMRMHLVARTGTTEDIKAGAVLQRAALVNDVLRDRAYVMLRHSLPGEDDGGGTAKELAAQRRIAHKLEAARLVREQEMMTKARLSHRHRHHHHHHHHGRRRRRRRYESLDTS
jgi:hypothetical protein